MNALDPDAGRQRSWEHSRAAVFSYAALEEVDLPAPPPKRLNRLALGLLVAGFSALGHTAFFAVATPPPKLPPPPLARSGLSVPILRAARQAGAHAERADLVARAQKARADGTLVLGEFLLQANDIDARAEQASFDLERARALYRERVRALRAAEGNADSLRRAVAETFGDLAYLGQPGGRMGDALLKGGGSCEPLSHLISATLHDTGDPARARLRYYGGETASATHLTPVLIDQGREHDLLTGRPSIVDRAGQPLGAPLAASDLVDVYARAHGLEPPAAPPHGAGRATGADRRTKGAPASEKSPPASKELSSLATGYPENRDRFPGAVPLFARQAVVPPNDAPAFVPESMQVENCGYFVRLAALDPPTLDVERAPSPRGAELGTFSVELRKIPNAAELDRTFALIRATEESSAIGAPPDRDEPADRAMEYACLVALYDRAATDLSLSSQPELAGEAMEKRQRALDAGEHLLASIDYSTPRGRHMLDQLTKSYAYRTWLLLMLKGGEDVVLRLATEGRSPWGRANNLAGLVVAPRTREAALELLGKQTRAVQLEVMDEVFRAHEHQRPWTSTYQPGGVFAGDADVARVYRVFRAAAWGLWEGTRSPVEVLDTLDRRASEERIDPRWLEVLIDYYARNAFGIHQTRKTGPEVSRALKRWLFEHGYTGLEVYRNALAGVEI